MSQSRSTWLRLRFGSVQRPGRLHDAPCIRAPALLRPSPSPATAAFSSLTLQSHCVGARGPCSASLRSATTPADCIPRQRPAAPQTAIRALQDPPRLASRWVAGTCAAQMPRGNHSSALPPPGQPLPLVSRPAQWRRLSAAATACPPACRVGSAAMARQPRRQLRSLTLLLCLLALSTGARAQGRLSGESRMQDGCPAELLSMLC